MQERGFVGLAGTLADSPSVLISHTYRPVGILVKRRKPPFATAQVRRAKSDEAGGPLCAFGPADRRDRVVDDGLDFSARQHLTDRATDLPVFGDAEETLSVFRALDRFGDRLAEVLQLVQSTYPNLEIVRS